MFIFKILGRQKRDPFYKEVPQGENIIEEKSIEKKVQDILTLKKT